MATGETQTALVPFRNKGVNLRVDPKELGPGEFQGLFNVTSDKEGSITPRRGRKRLGQLPSGYNIPHTCAKLTVNDNEIPGIPDLNPRYVGELYRILRTKTLADGSFVLVSPEPVCTAPTPLILSGFWSMAAYRAGSAGEAWAFIAGELAMLKDYGPHPMAYRFEQRLAPTVANSAGVVSVNPGIQVIATSAIGVKPIVVTFDRAHGLATGDTVIINSVVGAGQTIGAGANEYNAANGIHAGITVVDPTRISLPANTVGNVTYGSGGWMQAGLQTWGIRAANGVAQAVRLDVISTTTGSSGVGVEVTFSANHGLEKGSPVRLAGVQNAVDPLLPAPTGINGVTYYAKVIDTSTVSLYTDSALTIAFNTTAAGTGGHYAGNLDSSSNAAVAYKYVYTYRNPLTGNEGNPSQFMLEDSAVDAGLPINATQEAVVVQAVGTDDEQIPAGAANTVVFYRSGGLLTDGVYRFVGYGVNPGWGDTCSFLDNVADTDLVFESRVCEFDNDPPVTSTMPIPWNSTIVGQGVSNTPGTTDSVGPTGQTGEPIPVAVRDNPPSYVRVGSHCTITGLAGTSTQETSVIQSIETTVIAGVTYTTLFLYLQYQHGVGERIEISSVSGQPCGLTCSAFDSMFLAGDEINPHILYKSKTGKPESFPVIDEADVVHTMNVGSPANPIRGITEFRGNILCLNAQGLFEVSVFNGQMYGPNTAPAQRGLLTRKGFCVAENEVWYLAYDGIWSWSGGEAVKRSELLDPIFRGVETVVAGMTYLPMVMDPAVVQYARLEYARKKIHFHYRNTLGIMQELVYDLVFDRWLPGAKNGPLANQRLSNVYLERDTGNLLHFREDAAGAVISIDDLADSSGRSSDEYTTNPLTQGSAINWLATTAWMDLGNAFEAKVFDEVLLEADAQGAFQVRVFYDYGSSVSDTFNVPGSPTTGRAWIGLNLNLLADARQGGALTGYGRQAGVVAFEFLGQSQGYRPTIYGVKFRYRSVGELTGGPMFDWSDLGHKYDKRLYEFTVEFDSASTAHTLILDTIGGVKGSTETDDVQTFAISNPVILGPGRAKCTFPIKDGVVCKMVRLRSISTAPFGASPAASYFRILSVDFQKEDYPADIALFCEPEDQGYAWQKYLNQFTIDVDTNGRPVWIDLQAEGVTLERVSVTTNALDRVRTPTTNPNLRGTKWRWRIDTNQSAFTDSYLNQGTATITAATVGSSTVYTLHRVAGTPPPGDQFMPWMEGCPIVIGGVSVLINQVLTVDTLTLTTEARVDATAVPVAWSVPLGKFQVYGHSFKFQAADKGEVVHTLDWDDLGHPFDKRLYTVTLEWDNTGGVPVTMVLDLLSGIDGGTLQSTVQTFSLGTAGRSEKTFALADGLIAKKIRLYPQTSPVSTTFRHWKYYFQFEKYPADTVLFTEWEDGGNPWLKYLNQVTLDVDTNGQTINVQVQADGATIQTLPISATGATRDLTPTIKPNLVGRRFRLLVAANQTPLLNGTGKFQLFDHSFRWQPADKGEVGHTFDWDDLGWPYDKRLQTVTIEWDNTGNPDVTMQMDVRGGIGGGDLMTNTQQFTITGARSKRTWAINDTNFGSTGLRRNIGKLIRIYPLDDTTSFRQWKYSFEFIKYPADTVEFTDNRDFEFPYEKIAKVLDLKVDTQGTDALVQLIGDGQVMDSWTVNTTLDDWRRMLAVQKDKIAKLFRLAITPDPNGKFQLFDWSLLFQKEPPYITYWRSYELSLGSYKGWKFHKQMWVQYIAPQGLVVLLETDTGSYTKTLPAHTKRYTERFLLPDVFGSGLNKSKTLIVTFGSAGLVSPGGPSMQFGLPNNFAAGTVTLNIMTRIPYMFRRLDWNVSLDAGAMPTGQDAVFQVQISSNHGASWTPVCEIVVEAGGLNYGSVTDFDVEQASQGDWIKVVCVQAGSVVPGSGLQALMFGDTISPTTGPLFKIYPDGSGIEWIPCGADRHASYQQTPISDFMMFNV